MLKCLISMKQDLRVVKSRNAIEEAFINLVEIQGFENVTMTEIAEKAMVNRNTIYLNYGSKEGILKSIISGAFQKQFGDLDENFYSKISVSKKAIKLAIENIFTIIDENIELYRVLLLDNSSIGYLEMEANKVKSGIIAKFKPTKKNEAYLTFAISGFWGIISAYIIYAKGTKEENVDILTEMFITTARKMSF